MELNCWITIGQVKERIQRFLGVPVNVQSLYFNGRLLSDDQSEVATCGIVHDSRVNLLFPASIPIRTAVQEPPSRRRGAVIGQEPPSSAVDGGGEGPSRSPPSKRRGAIVQEPPSSVAGDSAIRGSDDLLNFERGLGDLEKEADSYLCQEQWREVTAPENSTAAELGGEENNINSSSSRRLEWSDVISPANSPEAGWGGEDLSVPELELQDPPPPPGAGDEDWSWSIDDLDLETLENNIKSSSGHQKIDADWKITEKDLEILKSQLNPPSRDRQGSDDVSNPAIPGNDADASRSSGVAIPTNSPAAGCSNKREGDVSIPSGSNPAIMGPRASWSEKMVVMVLPKEGKMKIPVEVTGSDRVKELRKKLERMQIELPPDGYFFIHKQSVMTEELSFLLNGVASLDTIEIFNGYVTSASP